MGLNIRAISFNDSITAKRNFKKATPFFEVAFLTNKIQKLKRKTNAVTQCKETINPCRI
jgi:hypothetical protein